jgi:transposase InsO family protein
MGTAFVHTLLDDHSRVAYAEIHDDETSATAIAVLRRAVAWFAARGVTAERLLTDNGSAYRSHAWRDACLDLGIKAKRTRPYRPQTNGKIERFHRTMADGRPTTASTSSTCRPSWPAAFGSWPPDAGRKSDQVDAFSVAIAALMGNHARVVASSPIATASVVSTARPRDITAARVLSPTPGP